MENGAKELVSAILNDDAVKMQDEFDALASEKLADAISSRKEEIGKTIFNSEQE